MSRPQKDILRENRKEVNRYKDGLSNIIIILCILIGLRLLYLQHA